MPLLFTSEMSIKQLYCYFFYTLYKLWLNIDDAFGANGVFSTSTKALITMFPVEIWLLFSIGIYYDHIFNIHKHIPLVSFPILVPSIFLLIIKWFFFQKKEVWKNYVKEFDKWSKREKRMGFWLVGIIIVFVILNFIYAVNLNLQPTGIKW